LRFAAEFAYIFAAKIERLIPRAPDAIVNERRHIIRVTHPHGVLGVAGMRVAATDGLTCCE